jgi:hypothetical protein
VSPQDWLGEILSASKREKSFRKEAFRVVGLYEAQKTETSPFPILFSNTQTLAPALYNAPPRPVVKPRSVKPDPIASAGARLVASVLEYLVDDGLGGSPAFDDLLQSAVLEALVPGRGLTRFKYEAKIAGKDGEESLEGEEICGEEVPWDRFFHGYAKKWDDVPWIAFLHYMDKEELEEHFPETYLRVTFSETEKETGEEVREQEERSAGEVAPVYEIWDKSSLTVTFLSPNLPDEFLKPPVPDPFGVSGFFPCPRPLCFFPKISTLVPVPLFRFYEGQAKELNAITNRIDNLIRAMKIRGFYDTTVEGMEKLLESPDNTLIPASNVAAMAAQGSSLDKAIWFFPIEKLVSVLQQLYVQRNQVKQVIYEITGIADIMRGSSAASETLGAQEIKNQWGTLRLKRMQKEVARYARDCLRIMTELSLTKLSADRLQEMAGTSYPKEAEQQQAQALAQQLSQLGQQPPEELGKLLSQPSIEAILRPISSSSLQHVRVSIETNSTVDAEATEDKANISELLNALAQFLNGVQPLVDTGALPFDAAKGMMLAIIKRFRFGPELEEELSKMTSPPPKEDPNAAKTQADQKAAEMDLQMKQAVIQMEQQKMQMELEFAKQEHGFRMQAAQQKMAMDMRQFQMKQEQAVIAGSLKSGGSTGQ